MKARRGIAVGIFFLAILLAAQSAGAQAIYISARVGKVRAAELERKLVSTTLSYSEADAASIKALVNQAKADGSLNYVTAAIAAKAELGTASLPELMFLIASGVYSPMAMDLARGALALAARDAGLELAASTFLVQLLHDNYGISIGYRMPTLEEQGITSIEILKARWADVERLLADGEDAQRWINKLVAAGEYDLALMMLDLAVKGKLVNPVYARMMRAGIEKLAAAALERALAADRMPERILAYSLKENEAFHSNESHISLAAGKGGYAIAIQREDQDYNTEHFIVSGGKEFGPVSSVRFESPVSLGRSSSSWAVAYNDDSTLYVDSFGSERYYAGTIGRIYLPYGSASAPLPGAAVEFDFGSAGGFLETGDGTRYAYASAADSFTDFGYPRNDFGSKVTSDNGDGTFNVKIGENFYGPFADSDAPAIAENRFGLWGIRDGKEYVVLNDVEYGPYQKASSPRFAMDGAIAYYRYVEDGQTWFNIASQHLGPFNAEIEASADIAFAPDGKAWYAAVKTKSGAWSLGFDTGDFYESLERPVVSFGKDGNWLAVLATEKGSLRFLDSKGASFSVLGEKAEAVYLDPDNGTWAAFVKTGRIARLVDSKGAALGNFETQDPAFNSQADAMASVGISEVKEGMEPYTVSRKLVAADGSVLVEGYEEISEFARSPDGKAWAVIAYDQDWETKLSFSDGTVLPVSPGAKIVMSGDASWWLFTDGKLISSEGETIENVAFVNWDLTATDKFLYWLEIVDKDIYYGTKRL